MSTRDETATGPPATMERVFMFRSWPERPMDPWMTAAPPLVVRRKNEAVPVRAAFVVVMALAVRTPPEAAGAKVADRGRSARRLFPERAVFALAGGVPSYMRRRPDAPIALVSASRAAFRWAVAMEIVMAYAFPFFFFVSGG